MRNLISAMHRDHNPLNSERWYKCINVHVYRGVLKGLVPANPKFFGRYINFQVSRSLVRSLNRRMKDHYKVFVGWGEITIPSWNYPRSTPIQHPKLQFRKIIIAVNYVHKMFQRWYLTAFWVCLGFWIYQGSEYVSGFISGYVSEYVYAHRSSVSYFCEPRR